MKDNFSERADQYVKFRPTYPQKLFDLLMPFIQTKEVAWDCGTGNGQVAAVLANFFKTVHATDISEAQLKRAAAAHNIIYAVEPAEKTLFNEAQFDLVTVAQAIHWFNFDEFYKEVRRVLKPAGILAVIGYGLVAVDEDTDRIIHSFYREVIGQYWDRERKYIDELYQTIPFPFKEIPFPQMYNEVKWKLDQFVGYIQTWSAVQHYKKATGLDPVNFIYPQLQKIWDIDEIKKVRFPILLRGGKQ